VNGGGSTLRHISEDRPMQMPLLDPSVAVLLQHSTRPPSPPQKQQGSAAPATAPFNDDDDDDESYASIRNASDYYRLVHGNKASPAPVQQ
jgi:hypothetical protein